MTGKMFVFYRKVQKSGSARRASGGLLLKCQSLWLKCQGLWLKCHGLWLKCQGLWLKCQGLWLKCQGLWLKCQGLWLKTSTTVAAMEAEAAAVTPPIAIGHQYMYVIEAWQQLVRILRTDYKTTVAEDGGGRFSYTRVHS